LWEIPEWTRARDELAASRARRAALQATPLTSYQQVLDALAARGLRASLHGDDDAYRIEIDMDDEETLLTVTGWDDDLPRDPADVQGFTAELQGPGGGARLYAERAPDPEALADALAAAVARGVLGAASSSAR
jgi:hypothetical protein